MNFRRIDHKCKFCGHNSISRMLVHNSIPHPHGICHITIPNRGTSSSTVPMEWRQLKTGISNPLRSIPITHPPPMGIFPNHHLPTILAVILIILNTVTPINQLHKFFLSSLSFLHLISASYFLNSFLFFLCTIFAYCFQKNFKSSRSSLIILSIFNLIFVSNFWLLSTLVNVIFSVFQA